MTMPDNNTIAVDARLYLLSLCQGIVAHPALVNVEATIDTYGLNLKVRAETQDMRVLIGKGGSVANTLRKIMGLWGKVHGARTNVVVYEG